MAGSKDKQAEPTKRPRLMQTDQAMASAPRPRRAVQPLTMTELTRGFLAHEDELQTILHQLSMVHKLPADGPLVVALVEAVQAWLQVHRPGKAHPSGSISSAVAGVLFPYLLNSKRPGEITEAQWDGLTSAVHALTSSAHPPAAYGREIALCSARATAKKDAVLLELRLKLHSTLLPHMLTYARLIEDYEGELLGKRSQGSLARKVKLEERLRTLIKQVWTPSNGISGTARHTPILCTALTGSPDSF